MFLRGIGNVITILIMKDYCRLSIMDSPVYVAVSLFSAILTRHFLETLYFFYTADETT